MAATPNPAKDQRKREHGWTTLPNEGPDTEPPALIGTGFDDRARDLWVHWWSTPMARMWGRFDAPVLENLLQLTARTWEPVEKDKHGRVINSVTGVEHAERRQLEDRFGLSPKSRRQLMWRIAGVDAPDEQAIVSGPTEANPSLPEAGGQDDPRQLRVVS